MKNLIGLILAIVSLTSCSDETNAQSTQSAKQPATQLIEFSTSMSFSEFRIVTKHLSQADALLSSEIDTKLDEFKKIAHQGETKDYLLSATSGKMRVNLDDADTIDIWIYVPKDKEILLSKAYDSAVKELGI